jgi:hypothetical protein
VEVGLTVGRAGQFDVVVDSVVVASREGGFLKRLVGGGWPCAETVIATLRQQAAMTTSEQTHGLSPRPTPLGDCP